MDILERLSPAERAQLEKTPVLIALLVGMADGKIDREEKTWADKITRARTYSKPAALQPFYVRVADGFWERLLAEEKAMPTDAATRNSLIVKELEKINPILAKLDPTIAAGFFRSFRSLAEEVAKASGGFLRFGAVSSEEAKWVELPMLKPIFSTDLEDEIEADFRAEDAEKEAEKGW